MLATAAAGADVIPAAEVPAEVRSFVEAGTLPIAIEHADLNGDGRMDVLLVLEKQRAAESDPEIEQEQRPLLILVREPSGVLMLRKRNEKVVYCSSCGGAMGDPFVGVQTARTAFTVQHYGGSAWRWSAEYTFRYSRRDDTWQLTLVEQRSFHALDPDDSVEVKAYKPPKDFGKIDIADFDPEDWRGRGAK
jgi:hypothetical protein